MSREKVIPGREFKNELRRKILRIAGLGLEESQARFDILLFLRIAE
jgi:hypothetical protein